MLMTIAVPLDQVLRSPTLPTGAESLVQDCLDLIFSVPFNLHGGGRGLNPSVVPVRSQEGDVEDRVNGPHGKRQLKAIGHRGDCASDREGSYPLWE